MERLSLRNTIKEILDIHLNQNNGILLGECVSDPGGVAGTIPESENVVDLPMTEVAGADFAVGCALAGRRPVFVVRFQDFMLMNGSPFIAFAAVTKQLHGISSPVFIRALGNDYFDATHSNVLHNLFMHFPGFKVCAPCTPGEYREAWDFFMKDDIPYYISEYRDTYNNTDEMPDIIDEEAKINLFGISVCRTHILEAKRILEKEGIKANVLNVVWLKPLSLDSFAAAIKKVPLGLVVDPGRVLCGAAEAVAFNIMKKYPGTYVDVLGIEDAIKTTNPKRYNEVPNANMIVRKVHDLLQNHFSNER